MDLSAALTFGTHDLSAFLMANCIQGMQLKGITMTQDSKQPKDTPQIFNVELQVTKGNQDPSRIFGEVSISDFLAGAKNAQESNKNLHRLGQNLSFDDWMYKLNKLRAAAQIA